MDQSNNGLKIGIVGFCLTFVVYQLLFNRSGAGIVNWILAFVIAGVVGGVAFFLGKKFMP